MNKTVKKLLMLIGVVAVFVVFCLLQIGRAHV